MRTARVHEHERAALVGQPVLGEQTLPHRAVEGGEADARVRIAPEDEERAPAAEAALAVVEEDGVLGHERPTMRAV